MSEAKIALLPDRGVVSVTGEDARKLLGGIITNDIDLLETQPAIFAGLLSPQGKILFDFFVYRERDRLLIDVASDQVAALIKRLTMYKLRAKATIEDQTSALAVVALWLPDQGIATTNGMSIIDPRNKGLGSRAFMPRSEIEQALNRTGGTIQVEPAAYHAHRIALGIPEGGRDWDFGDAFPHEANFDLLNGVSFTKGCYVGQEIVARMEHRGTVRKRIVGVTGRADLAPDRPDVLMGDVVIGKLGSVAGNRGLALIRLDRAIEAIDKGTPIMAAGIPLEIEADMIARQRRLMAEKAAGS